MGTLEKAAKELQESGSDLDLQEAINQIASIKDPAERSAKAEELLGKKAAYEMAPMLNQGSEGITAMYEEAEQLGIIMSDDAVKSGAAFNDAMTKVNKTVNALKNKMAAEFLPALTSVSEGLAKMLSGNTAEGEKELTKGITDMAD
jgi:hypothetical protein